MGQTELRLRPLACKLSLLSRADRLASFCFGDETFVVACVYGPTDVRISKEKIDRATIEVGVLAHSRADQSKLTPLSHQF